MTNLDIAKETELLNFEVDEHAFNAYLKKKDSIANDRIRPDNQNFFDALLSVDMKNDPDGIKIINYIKAL